MQTKQFTGTSIDEVLRKIRADLGDDAVILETRRVVRGGLGGFFGREMIEVTAADGVEAEGAVATTTAASDEDHAPEADAPSAERAAAPSVLDVRDEDEAPVPFVRQLQGRLADTGAEDHPAGGATVAGPAAAPASAYARAAAPPAETPSAPAAEAAPAPIAAEPAGARPIALGDVDRTNAIIEAARAAMRAAEEGRPATVPPPPAFIPARRPAEWDERGRAISAPAWERIPAPVPGSAAVIAPPPAELRAERSAAAPVLAPVAAPPPAPVPGDEDGAPVSDHLPGGRPEADAGEDAGIVGRTAALRAVRADLLAAGVDARYLDPFLDGVARNALPFLPEGGDVRAAVRAAIAGRIPVSREWTGRPRNQALAFVGQTGVGKSTVVRKLAWRLHRAGMTVAVVCAGAEADPSLESLATRLGLAYAHVQDGEALAAVRTELGDCDMVLIDTPGRSHTNLGDMEELGRLLSDARIEEVHLVLPVAVALADMGDVSRRFRIAGVNRLTLTKLDETRLLGNLVNIPLRMAKPLAFLADGPSTAGDLAPADPQRVAELLLP